MIDPLTALAGIQAAVALIKKVSKTVDDVSSLGPVLGKYFDAKSTASKAVVEAKNNKNLILFYKTVFRIQSVR